MALLSYEEQTCKVLRLPCEASLALEVLKKLAALHGLAEEKSLGGKSGL